MTTIPISPRPISARRHETRALLRAHLAAASAYRHATRHCPVCHRLQRLAMESGPEPEQFWEQLPTAAEHEAVVPAVVPTVVPAVDPVAVSAAAGEPADTRAISGTEPGPDSGTTCGTKSGQEAASTAATGPCTEPEGV